MEQKQRKVVVIGAGSVGTAYIYALLPGGMAEEIYLVDIDENRVEGEVMDLSHGLPFVPPVRIEKGDYSACADADLIVVTAGAKQQPGQTRLDLIKKNVGIIKTICGEIKKYNSNAVFVMVTNPVDVLTYVALKELGWPKNRVIGSGTVLDSARFRFLLSRNCEVDTRNVHAYVIGEHGDSEVIAWSMAHIAGIQLKDYCPTCGRCDFEKLHNVIEEQVRSSAYHIIDYKGSTYYGIGLSLVRISGAILRNERSILTISTLLQGEYGIEDICLSVPVVVGENGVEQICKAQLTESESADLQKSADIIRQTLSGIG
ncbi:MAG: L-lactate dehydrogenase [Sedimentisphaerales bacterium]|nr:L-lactate dehydrogenase [Sedimentisphaerales bacterium]